LPLENLSSYYGFMSKIDISSPNFRSQFSGHETFPLRHGWLKKAHAAVAGAGTDAGNYLFKNPEAVVRFGVGKNMALSIRYWAFACNILQETESGGLKATEFGDFLLGPEALDQYLESTASIWLLHWMLAGINPSKATTWYWAFNYLPTQQFERAGLSESLLSTAKERGWKQNSLATFKRDVECFIRCYVPKSGKGVSTEERVETPLSELSLITQLGASSFRFNRGPQLSLPDELFAWSLFEYWKAREGSNVMTVEQVTYEPGSPGRVFKLDDTSVAERLSRLSDLTEGKASWSDTSGLRQVHIHEDYEDRFELLRQALNTSELSNVA
jgi:hypothetical protein